MMRHKAVTAGKLRYLALGEFQDEVLLVEPPATNNTQRRSVLVGLSKFLTPSLRKKAVIIDLGEVSTVRARPKPISGLAQFLVFFTNLQGVDIRVVRQATDNVQCLHVSTVVPQPHPHILIAGL